MPDDRVLPLLFKTLCSIAVIPIIHHAPEAKFVLMNAADGDEQENTKSDSNVLNFNLWYRFELAPLCVLLLMTPFLIKTIKTQYVDTISSLILLLHMIFKKPNNRTLIIDIE